MNPRPLAGPSSSVSSSVLSAQTQEWTFQGRRRSPSRGLVLFAGLSWHLWRLQCSWHRPPPQSEQPRPCPAPPRLPSPWLPRGCRRRPPVSYPFFAAGSQVKLRPAGAPGALPPQGSVWALSPMLLAWRSLGLWGWGPPQHLPRGGWVWSPGLLFSAAVVPA